ncbi:MAG TPA: hypothetical protein VH560_08090 [Polyangia bacterium]|nr:hypothetical protein [Polyangia bacterium]
MAVVSLSVGATGCASGGSDGTGTAGSGGGAGGAACTLDQVNTIFTGSTANHNCTTALACHDASGSAAGLDLASVGWQTKLVGMGPTTGAGAANYMTKCGGMGFKYLNAGSKPATGFFLDKINPQMTTPPCGDPMPQLFARLSTSEFACVQSWATTLTSP